MVYLGSDHGGFTFKEKIKSFLEELKVGYEDLGNSKFDPFDDFPDFALKVAKKVVETNGKGILICTNGLGMAMAANKVKGIRAVNVTTEKVAKQAREHLDSNVLCIGAHIISFKNAKKIIKTWLETDFFKKEKYIRRLEKLKQIENMS